MRKVERVRPVTPRVKPKKKVAAYARVSMETERLMHSLSAQVSHYSKYIQKNPAWEYAGVYSDDGISGTGTKKRKGFQQLIADAEDGKIDIILTKSISRFARNTVDLLETVRHLKDKGIEVRFEREHISSMSSEGELMLTILASFAQEESRSISENVKWAIQKGFRSGIPNGGRRIYGYRWDGNRYLVEPAEAGVVRRIFEDFLRGNSPQKITKWLVSEGRRTVRGCLFYPDAVRRILRNVTYTGSMLLQKTYISDAISKKRRKNRGELPKYYVEETHEAIVTQAVFLQTQKEMLRRKELGTLANSAHKYTCFTRKIQCGLCGKNYIRNESKGRNGERYAAWICGTRQKHGDCTAKYMPEEKLKALCIEVLGLSAFDESCFQKAIERIIITGPNRLKFIFYDGRVIEKAWQSTARRDWWTPERRAERSRKWKEKHKNAKEGNNHTSIRQVTE